MAAVAAVAVGVFCCSAVGVRAAGSDGISEEIGARVDQYITDWNTHDPAALAEHFTADADMIMGTGAILSGRTGVSGWWRTYFAAQEPARKLTIDILSTRAITDDVAVVNVRTTTGGRSAEGLELPARVARGTWVVVREDGVWLIAALRGMPTEQDRIIRTTGVASSPPIGGSMSLEDMETFARRYTAAWCSQDAARVASFFAPDGSLTINAGPSSVGPTAITAAAQAFMTAFPDLLVTMDGLERVGDGFIYRWTLTGTNTGPGGTGNRVRISGYEEWTIGDDHLIASSLGHFDEDEYRRQLGAAASVESE